MLLLRILSCLVTAMLFTAVRAELFLYNSTVLKDASSLAPQCIDSMSASIACDPALLPFASVGYVNTIQPALLRARFASRMCAIEACETTVPRPACSSGLIPFGQRFGLNVTVSFDQYKRQPCYSNQMYNIVEGDTCKSISEKMSVDTGTLQILNNLYADCSNMVVGMELCLPRKCETYCVKDGDTCHSIRKARRLSFGQLIYNNPTVNQDCSNLIVGDYICVSPPGGYPVLRVVPDTTVNTTEGLGLHGTASV